MNLRCTVVVLAVLGAVQPSPVCAAYRNAALGFELEAPAGWTLSEPQAGHVRLEARDAGLAITIKIVDKDATLGDAVIAKLRERELQALGKTHQQVLPVPMSGPTVGGRTFHHGFTWRDRGGTGWFGRTALFEVTVGPKFRWFHVQGRFPGKQGEKGTAAFEGVLRSFKLFASAAADAPSTVASPSAAASPGTTDPGVVEPLPSTENSMKVRFVRIPAGTFQMGSTTEEQVRHYPDRYLGRIEAPRHAVEITRPFLMSVHEVSRWEWEAVMRTTPWKDRWNEGGEPSPYKPASKVTWHEAVLFCNKLSAIEKLPLVYTFEDSYFGYSQDPPPDFDGKLNVNLRLLMRTRVTCDWSSDGYRLPTEAEWEYACRAGMATAFSWGDDPGFSRLAEHAWCGEEKRVTYDESDYDSWRDRPKPEPREVHIVGRKRPNRWGLFDMAGNVSEWVFDSHDEDYYSRSPAKDPHGPDVSADAYVKDKRVVRGGSYESKAIQCRSADRQAYSPLASADDRGFRLVRTVRK